MKIALLGVRPPVWLRVQVSGEMLLAELYELVQLAMGWTVAADEALGQLAGTPLKNNLARPPATDGSLWPVIQYAPPRPSFWCATSNPWNVRPIWKRQVQLRPSN